MYMYNIMYKRAPMRQRALATTARDLAAASRHEIILAPVRPISVLVLRFWMSEGFTRAES